MSHRTRISKRLGPLPTVVAGCALAASAAGLCGGCRVDAGPEAAGPERHDPTPLSLERREVLLPAWTEPRILDTALYETVERSATEVRVRGQVMLEPGRTAVIGPRAIAADARTAAALLATTRLRVDGRPVDLSRFPALEPRELLLGPRQQEHLGIGSAYAAQRGVVAAELAAGEHLLELTEALADGGAVRTLQSEITLTVRPYAMDRLSPTEPPPPAPGSDQPEIPADATVILGGTLFDGTGGPALPNAVIALRGRHILAVAAPGQLAVPAGATRIDAAGKTLLPGFIDAHLHYLPDRERPPERWLRAGVTTLVDLGGSPEALFTLRELFFLSAQPRPALFAAGAIVGRSEHSIRRRWGEGGFFAVDDVAAARDAARALVRGGADLAKIALGDGDGPAALTEPQICAVTEVLHQAGLKVVAHASSTDDIRRAVACAVDAVTHLPPLDPATIDLLAGSATAVVPTLNIYAGERLDRALSDVAALHRRGVKIGAGDDFPAGGRPGLVRELLRLERAGLTPAQAIEAATRVNAEILGIDDAVGTVTPGKLADLVAIDGDPLARLDRTRSVAFVVAGGRLVR